MFVTPMSYINMKNLKIPVCYSPKQPQLPQPQTTTTTSVKHWDCQEILTCSQELKHSVIFNTTQMNTTEITFLRACTIMGRRLIEWLRLDSISGDHLIQLFCSSPVRYSRLPKIVSGWVLRMYTGGDPSAFRVNLFQCSATVMEKFFLMFNQNFYISVWIHCLLSYHWPPVKRVYLVSFIPSISYFYTFIMFPWTLFSPGWIVPPLHSCGRFSSPSIFSSILLDSFYSLGLLFHTSLVLVGSELDSAPDVSHKCWAEAKDHLLQFAGNTFTVGVTVAYVPWDGSLSCFLCCKADPIAVFSIN